MEQGRAGDSQAGPISGLACLGFLQTRGKENREREVPSQDTCFNLAECLDHTWQLFLLHLPISLGFLNHADHDKRRRLLLIVVGKESSWSFMCRVTP